MVDGKPVLRLALTAKADDVFVEGGDSAYFHAPVFSADGRTADLRVGNVADPAKLAGQSLRVTVRHGNTGSEQTITLP